MDTQDEKRDQHSEETKDPVRGGFAIGCAPFVRLPDPSLRGPQVRQRNCSRLRFWAGLRGDEQRGRMGGLAGRKMGDGYTVAARGAVDREVAIAGIASDVLAAMGTGEFDLVQHLLSLRGGTGLRVCQCGAARLDEPRFPRIKRGVGERHHCRHDNADRGLPDRYDSLGQIKESQGGLH